MLNAMPWPSPKQLPRGSRHRSLKLRLRSQWPVVETVAPAEEPVAQTAAESQLAATSDAAPTTSAEAAAAVPEAPARPTGMTRPMIVSRARPSQCQAAGSRGWSRRAPRMSRAARASLPWCRMTEDDDRAKKKGGKIVGWHHGRRSLKAPRKVAFAASSPSPTRSTSVSASVRSPRSSASASARS